MNWGIMGTGTIAHRFAEALNYDQNAVLYACASRTEEKAEAFRKAFGVRKAYGSYEAMAADPDVDIIYVATPMSAHYDNVRLCFEHNKAVLCEKAVTETAAEFAGLAAMARSRKLFFMEAMWMKCHEGFRQALSWVREGRIGKLQSVRADFSKFLTYDPESRLFKKELGGGARLDLTVYTTAFCTAFLGNEPSQIFSCQAPTPAGTDYYNSTLMTYPDGTFAAMNAGFGYYTPVSGIILGDRGRIEFDEFFIRHNNVTLYNDRGEAVERFEKPFGCNGYEGEAAEAERCLREGLTESPLVPLDDSLAVLKILDAIRACWQQS